MTEEELKDRISMALKDPILQQGFECICKENAELKKKQFSLRNERNTFLAQNEQYEKDLIDFNEKLTRAKRLITRLSACFGSYATNIFGNELLKEAEQFLNEVSE